MDNWIRKSLFDYYQHRVRLKRNSEDVNTEKEGDRVLCNTKTGFSCQCTSCDHVNYDNNDNNRTKCCDLVLQNYSSDSLRIVFKRNMSERNNSITEVMVRNVVASVLRDYCTSSPTLCGFKSDANVATMFSMQTIFVSGIDIRHEEQTFTLVVIFEKDTYNQNAVIPHYSGNNDVSYPVSYLRSALKNCTSCISESLGIELKSISLALNMPTVDRVSTESYILTTEDGSESDNDDLSVTGVVFGGIFAFLLLFTCLASACKAVK